VNLVSFAIATYVTIQFDNQIVCQTVPASGSVALTERSQ